MSKKNKGDLNWFQEWTLSIFDKIYGHFDDEDAEARFNKSRGIKSINISWIIIIVILAIAYFVFNFFRDTKNTCLFKAEEAYHQEEKLACEKLGQQLGCDLYFMDTPTWGDINARHDANVKACK